MDATPLGESWCFYLVLASLLILLLGHVLTDNALARFRAGALT